MLKALYKALCKWKIFSLNHLIDEKKAREILSGNLEY